MSLLLLPVVVVVVDPLECINTDSLVRNDIVLPLLSNAPYKQIPTAIAIAGGLLCKAAPLMLLSVVRQV